MDSWIATFYTHYGALKFYNENKARYAKIRQMPVPRAISSSCGTCVMFEAAEPEIPQEQEDMEGLYRVLPGGGYVKVPENSKE